MAGVLLAAGIGRAQDTPLDPHSSIAIDLPPDSPVTLVSADMGESRASARGGAMVARPAHVAQAAEQQPAADPRRDDDRVGAGSRRRAAEAPGRAGSMWGRAKCSRCRSTSGCCGRCSRRAGRWCRSASDGILFNDFSFYGPNRFDSKRTMMVWADRGAAGPAAFQVRPVAVRGRRGCSGWRSIV